MSFDAIISISGMIAGLAGIGISWRAWQQSVKTAEPDPELVRRFVESAPLHLLGKNRASRRPQYTVVVSSSAPLSVTKQVRQSEDSSDVRISTGSEQTSIE